MTTLASARRLSPPVVVPAVLYAATVLAQITYPLTSGAGRDRITTLVVLLGAWAAPLGEPARASVDAGLKRALVAFAAARTLGAVVSVAQGTQVDIKPGGVGVGTAPGQVLQPVNELVDHFATAMLAASVAFGVQRVLLDIGGAPAVTGFNSAACGSCWNLTFTNGQGKSTSITITAIDVATPDFNIGLTAMNELTGNQAVQIGRAPITAAQIAASNCGL